MPGWGASAKRTKHMKCVICGKKACVAFGSWPESETMGLCEEHLSEVNIWRLQRTLDVKQVQTDEEAEPQQKREVS